MSRTDKDTSSPGTNRQISTSETGSLSLGFSPCPNDTFIFHALVHGLVDGSSGPFQPHLKDVETLNQMALAGGLDVTKVSYGAIPFMLDDYVLLRSGGALGRGCGPLLVAREQLPLDSLATARIVIPGRLTTANLLLRISNPTLADGEETLYSEIMPAVAGGRADAGLIIHESRFTYRDYGLVSLLDLGEWWERETGRPIPLGGIVAKRSLGEARISAIEEAIRASVEFAFANPEASSEFMREHAQEMDKSVMRSHVDLYVNRFSMELGEEGEAAVRQLLERAAALGLAPPSADPFPG